MHMDVREIAGHEPTILPHLDSAQLNSQQTLLLGQSQVYFLVSGCSYVSMAMGDYATHMSAHLRKFRLSTFFLGTPWHVQTTEGEASSKHSL